MVDYAIRVEKLGKMYHIGAVQARYKTIRETIQDGFKAPFRRAGRIFSGQAHGAAELDQTIWALRDISLQIDQGEVLGIIGRNGAGKSTLLKILSRITDPTEGDAWINGRVGSLLEVGTGFHPELTGRENVYLNGSILGMRRREIDRKFDDIVEFAEIEKFIDTPVKHFSSGMYVRLAFSVASHLDPEILLVDEVLAVGDYAFQNKCLGRMRSASESKGRSVFFVSHNMPAIRQLCSRVAWIDNGTLVQIGDTRNTVDAYISSATSAALGRADLRPIPRAGDHGRTVKLTSCTLLDSEGKITSSLKYGEPFEVLLECESRDTVGDIAAIVGFESTGRTRIASSVSEDDSVSFGLTNNSSARIGVAIEGLMLNSGTYQITVALRSGRQVLDRVPDCLDFSVLEVPYGANRLAKSRTYGLLRQPGNWSVEKH